MKAKEFDIKKRDPNWRAMQDIRRSGAGGQHKDKKRAAKQGEVKHKGKDVAEAIDIGQEWMTDTELDQYVPDDLQQEWRELVGYDEEGNAHPLWANMTGDYEPDVSDPQHRAWMVKVANKWFAMKKIPNVRFFDVRDLDDELEWLVQIGDQGVAEGTDFFDRFGLPIMPDDDGKFQDMMRGIKRGTKKQARADRRERDAASRERARAAFGPSPADKLSIRSDKGVAEEEDFTYTTEKQILTRIRQIMYDRKLSGTESNAGELYRLKQQLKDMRSQQSVSEGDEPDEQYLDKVISDLHKDAFGMRPDHEFGREWMSSSYEEKLRIFKNMLKNLHSDLDEASDWGDPREILEDVLRTLEREVEWPLTEVMDPKEVSQLLAPIIKAVNDKMMSMDEAQDDWGSMSHREFKRRELQHELGHEDDPEFQRMMREKDRGPWYIKIDGKIYKQKGEPKVFDWKKGANNYALAILKNRPELKDKIVLTKNPVDQ